MSATLETEPASWAVSRNDPSKKRWGLDSNQVPKRATKASDSTNSLSPWPSLPRKICKPAYVADIKRAEPTRGTKNAARYRPATAAIGAASRSAKPKEKAQPISHMPTDTPQRAAAKVISVRVPTAFLDTAVKPPSS